jgi:hypothetical protein
MAKRKCMCLKKKLAINVPEKKFVDRANCSNSSEYQIVVLKTIPPSARACPCPYPAVKGLFVGFDF